MTCKELKELIPDMVDGTLDAVRLAEAEAALPGCPECQRELAIARQVRTFMVELQTQYVNLQVPPGFEARLMERVRQQTSGLELLDLSSKAFGIWLVELINLIGGLLNIQATTPARS